MPAERLSLLGERRALVTGGANGIGRAIVERFVAEGAAVATVDVEPVDDLGADVIAIQRDLAATDDLAALVDEVEERLGPLDVLVNNAGIFEPAQCLRQTSGRLDDQYLQARRVEW